ncbi:MAG: histidine kinase [Bacteroidales bacterium]|nr:histidine kinase [Bacteroidales bacterium]
MKRAALYKRISIHLVAWLIAFSLNFLFLQNYSIDFDIIHLSSWLSFLVLFYVTYLFIIPFLFRKKHLLFILLSLLLLAATYIGKELVISQYFESRGPQMPGKFQGQPPSGFMPREREGFNDGPGSYNPDGDPREFSPGQNPGPPMQESHEFSPGHKPGSQMQQASKFRPYPGRDRQAFRILNVGRILMNTSGMLLFYLLAISIRFVMKSREDETKRSELEKEKIRTELSFLKQQINPHFLFNSLNSIYSLSLIKSKLTTDAILRLSSILRYVIYDSEYSSVALKKELETMQDYVEMQKLRLTVKTKLSFDSQGEPEDYMIEPLLLLPLLENAFKYGTDNVNESFINIDINIEDEHLCLKVANVIVTKIQSDRKDYGVGIKNLKRRLELLYPDSHLLNISEKDNIFTVYLELKLKK